MDAPDIDRRMVFTGLVDILEGIHGGRPFPDRLQQALDAAVTFTGALGACYLATEVGAIRITATTASASWMEGRSIPLADSSVAKLFGRSVRSYVFDTSTAAPVMREPMAAHGLHRVMLARVMGGPRPLGALGLFWADAGYQPSPVQTAVAEFVASAIGAMVLARPVDRSDPLDVTSQAWPDGLALLGDDGLVQAWNPTASDLTGLLPEHVLGKAPPFPVPLPGQVIEHRLDDGSWIELRCALMNPWKVVTFRDVTAPRLEDEARDLFLATTGHELRTPLTVVRGYADTLATHWDEMGEPQRRAAVDVIVGRTRQLAELVDRLLLASHDQAQALAGERRPFDLRAALAEVLEHAPASEGGHRLVVDLPESLPWAVGDRSSIATVVTELLTNAYKYSPEGGDVELVAGADASSVWFRVADRGVGMCPEHIDSAFTRFWQAEQGDQRRFGGVGLGLYIVRRLLDRQGGWISLRPRPGGGMVAEVRLALVAGN